MATAAANKTAPELKTLRLDAAPVKVALELEEVDEEPPLDAVVEAGETVNSVVVAVTVYVALLLV